MGERRNGGGRKGRMEDGGMEDGGMEDGGKEEGGMEDGGMEEGKGRWGKGGWRKGGGRNGCTEATGCLKAAGQCSSGALQALQGIGEYQKEMESRRPVTASKIIDPLTDIGAAGSSCKTPQSVAIVPAVLLLLALSARMENMNAIPSRTAVQLTKSLVLEIGRFMRWFSN